MVRTKDGRRCKHVTWSPVVVGVSRSQSKRKKSNTRAAKSVFTMHPPDGIKRTISGLVTAHSRRDTHSVLVTIRNNRHRDMQILLDLSEQRVRRIYDGAVSWNIRPNETKQFRMDCNLETISWADDGEERDAAARGFRLDWLNGEHVFPVAISGRSTRAQHSKHRRNSILERHKRSSRRRAHRSKKR